MPELQQLAPTLNRVLTAVALLSEASAADIAARAGLGYSTTTPKLRDLETNGLAQRRADDNGKTLWSLTAAGGLAATVTAGPDHTGDTTPVHEPAPDPEDADTAADPVAPAPEPATDAVTGLHAADSDSGGEQYPQHVSGEVAADTPDGDSTQTVLAPVDNDTCGEHPAASAAGSLTDVNEPAAPVAGETPADEPTVEPPAPDDLTASGATNAVALEQLPEPAEAAAVPPASDEDGGAAEGKPRRPSGQLRAEVRRVLHDNPGQTFKVSQMCKAVAAASGSPVKSLGGSVANALAKLVNDGEARIVSDTPATYQAV